MRIHKTFEEVVKEFILKWRTIKRERERERVSVYTPYKVHMMIFGNLS